MNKQTMKQKTKHIVQFLGEKNKGKKKKSIHLDTS